LEILPSPNSKSLGAYIFWAHTSFIGREDFNGRLVTVVYHKTRTFLLWRIYFIFAQIFWIGANVMGANISVARIFCGREYFDVSEYFGYAQIFQDVRIYLIGSEHFDMRRYLKMCAYIFDWKQMFYV
jgi:hypothetical protein